MNQFFGDNLAAVSTHKNSPYEERTTQENVRNFFLKKIVFVDFEHEDSIIRFYNLHRCVVRSKTPQIKKKSVKKRHPGDKLCPFQFQADPKSPFQYQGKILVAILGGRCWLRKKKKNPPRPGERQASSHVSHAFQCIGACGYVPSMSLE